MHAEPAAWDTLELPSGATIEQMSLEDRFIACVGSKVVRL
jgi:hypothetical protein